MRGPLAEFFAYFVHFPNYASVALVAIALAQFTPLRAHADAGFLRPPTHHAPRPQRLLEPGLDPALAPLTFASGRYAPVFLQRVDPANGPLDLPCRLDADGSGRLEDDAAALLASSPDEDATPSPAPCFTARSFDAERAYFFYGLYYAADLAACSDTNEDAMSKPPEIDHPGDFEGALVIVDRKTATVEAVITQAHQLFYLWIAAAVDWPDASSSIARAASGIVSQTSEGRPLLYIESGGHGIYAWGSGRFHPIGGTPLEDGPAAIPREQLRALVLPDESGLGYARPFALDLEPLADLERFTDGLEGGFRGLTDASPPWCWQDRRGIGRRGNIVRDPARLYRRLLRAWRP